MNELEQIFGIQLPKNIKISSVVNTTDKVIKDSIFFGASIETTYILFLSPCFDAIITPEFIPKVDIFMYDLTGFILLNSFFDLYTLKELIVDSFILYVLPRFIIVKVSFFICILICKIEVKI